MADPTIASKERPPVSKQIADKLEAAGVRDAVEHVEGTSYSDKASPLTPSPSSTPATPAAGAVTADGMPSAPPAAPAAPTSAKPSSAAAQPAAAPARPAADRPATQPKPEPPKDRTAHLRQSIDRAQEKIRAAAAADGDAGAAPAPAAQAAAGAASADEYEDVDFTEAEGLTAPVRIRAPKGSAQQVRSAMLRNADYTKKTQALARYRPLIQPLIEDGRMEAIAPMIEAATRHQGFADGVARMYTNLTNGRPLTEGLTAQQGAPQEQQSAPPADWQQDPTLALAQVSDDDIYSLDQWNPEGAKALAFSRKQAQDQVAQRAAQERYQGEQQIRTQTAHYLRATFPQDFGGIPNEEAARRMNALERYAIDAGFVQQYGLTNGMISARQQIIAQNAGQAQQQHATAEPSPAAEAVNDMEARALAHASQAAGNVARSIGVGGAGAPPQAAPQKLRTPRVGEPLPNGKKVDLRYQTQWIKQHAAELMAAAQAKEA